MCLSRENKQASISRESSDKSDSFPDSKDVLRVTFGWGSLWMLPRCYSAGVCSVIYFGGARKEVKCFQNIQRLATV
jgi:hypothetical protein